VDTFWSEVSTCLDELEAATTADAVIDGLNKHFSPSSGDAFFGGSGWKTIWAEAPYYYVARNSAGELITYVEGDVYRGDRR
jgi:hypothetical protein